MSKLFKIIITLFLVLLTDYAKAKTPTVEYIDNVYANRISNSQSITGQLGYIYMDGQIAFCIDPFKIIGNNYEVNNEIINEFYTKEEQRKIQLIVHYGAATHLNNPYYYMATQELIWEIKGEGEYYFTKTSNLDSERIDIEVYKKDIMSHVEKHDVLPSFANVTLTPKLYDKIELNDQNEVFNHYDILNLSSNTIIRRDNSLSIQIKDKTQSDITLSYLTHSGIISNVYVGNGQTLITSSISEQKNTYIHLNPTGVSYYLKIKFLEDNRSIFGKIKFKIYNHNTSQYIESGKVFESDYFGVFISDFKLELGSYEIAYVDIPKGYIAPPLSNQFTLEDDTPVNNNLEYEITSYLDVPNGKLTINRTATLYDGHLKKLDGIEYKIYASSNIYDAHSKLLYSANEYIDSIKTENGKAEIILPIGAYYLEEQSNQYGIPVSSKQSFWFTYQDSITEMYYKEINLNTNLPTFSLDIRTLQEQIDGNYIGYDHYQYKLYAKEDIVYLNEIIFQKGHLIQTLTSSNQGYIYENLLLPHGEYEIQEINVDDNYYENEKIQYSFNSENSYLSHIVKKNLKRGNLKIKIDSEIKDVPDMIYFIYDKEYSYDIDNELFIDDIKIGTYKVIYDKEYSVVIYPNETTILEIKIEKSNNGLLDSENNKDDSQNEPIQDDDINVDKEDDSLIRDEMDNIKKEEHQNEQIEIGKEIPEESQNDEIKVSQNNNIENNQYNVETLPETYNTLKKYYYLFYSLMIIGFILKFYEKKS